MKQIRLLAAVTLLVPSIPSTSAIARAPQWNGITCLSHNNEHITCFFETRGECEYTWAQTRRDDRTLTLTRCKPSDDPVNVGAEWEFDIFD